MDSTTTIVIAIVVIGAVLAGLAATVLAKRRTQRLKARFGPEYDLAVDQANSRGQAEGDLETRERHVAAATLHDLTPGDRDRYQVSWRMLQARFVDDPQIAVSDADALLGEVMSTRGYPMGDFAQRSGDLSVNHPLAMQNYRTAHAVAHRPETQPAGTEDLRRAMILYRGLFNDLVGEAA